MGLVIAGIDEAGYGPMLGPLCVGCAAFRVERWSAGEEAPDLWVLLRDAVCRESAPKTRPSRGSRTRRAAFGVPRRVAIADSKELKLANTVTTKHPLVHLERGVLAFLRAAGAEESPPDDERLFGLLGGRLEPREWYGGEPRTLPVGQTAGELAIAGGRLAAAMERAEVSCHGLRCEVVPEGVFNETVRRTGSKADATLLAIGEHLRRVLAACEGTGDEVRIVCDRLGGRTAYQSVLGVMAPGRGVVILDESEARSRYEIRGVPAAAGSARRVIVQFMVDGESAHLPIALASMIAKYVRELAMMRFNRYWCSRAPDLKPTAGYRSDAWRWLRDARGVVSSADREAMVRLA